MLVQEGTKLTSSPQKDNYEENKIDELRLLLESQRQDYRARFAAYGARSAVLIAGSGAFVAFLSGSNVYSDLRPSFYLVGALLFAVLSTIFAMISLKPVNGSILRLHELEYEIRDFNVPRMKEHLYRQELAVAKSDEKLLAWRSKWLGRSIYCLVLSAALLSAKVVIPLLSASMSF